MEENKTIEIACEGTLIVTLDELKEMHHYKDLSSEAYKKGKTSILKLGFSFPVFLWEDKFGTKWIIDSHQRKRILMQMRSEGYAVPPLPAVRIFAKDKKEAKEKILAQESHYGKIQEPELYEFINEEDSPLLEDELDTFTEIYELNMEYDNNPKKEDDEETRTKKETCPQCKTYHDNNHQ